MTAASGPPAGSWPRTVACCSAGALRRPRRRDRRARADGVNLISSLQSFVAQRPDRGRGRQADRRAEAAGPRASRSCTTSTSSSPGINAYLAANSPTTAPWTRNDVYALNALKGQFVGEGGGDEARRSEFLGGLEQRLGVKHGLSVFNDLRQFKNAGSPTSVDGNFNYGNIPNSAPGSVVLDPGSFQSTPAVPGRGSPGGHRAPPATQASNTLMITANHSKTGHPLMVGGPQIGYFYPGLTLEMDMHAPDLDWRGATSAPFPGYMLIGRGADFAWTLTSAGGDIIDQYAETLCGGSDTQVPVQGPVPGDGSLRRRQPQRAQPVHDLQHHGPRAGRRLRDGPAAPRSRSRRKRSSYGKDALDLLFFQPPVDRQGPNRAKTFLPPRR